MNTWVLMALLVVAFAAVHTTAAQQAQPARLPPAGELPQMVAFNDTHVEGVTPSLRHQRIAGQVGEPYLIDGDSLGDLAVF